MDNQAIIENAIETLGIKIANLEIINARLQAENLALHKQLEEAKK